MTVGAMSVAEFGRRIGVSRSSAYDIVATGEVDLTDVGTRGRARIRITERALQQYLDRKQIPGRRAK